MPAGNLSTQAINPHERRWHRILTNVSGYCQLPVASEIDVKSAALRAVGPAPVAGGAIAQSTGIQGHGNLLDEAYLVRCYV